MLALFVIGDPISDWSAVGYIVTILCDVNDAPLLPLSFDGFPPNFP